MPKMAAPISMAMLRAWIVAASSVSSAICSTGINGAGHAGVVQPEP